MELVIKQLSQFIGAYEFNKHQITIFLLRVLLVLTVMTAGAVLNVHWSIAAFVIVVGLIQLERIFSRVQEAKAKLIKLEFGKKIISDLYNKYDFIDKLKIENISRKKEQWSIELTVYTVINQSDIQQRQLQKIKQRLIEKHQFNKVFIHLSTLA